MIPKKSANKYLQYVFQFFTFFTPTFFTPGMSDIPGVAVHGRSDAVFPAMGGDNKKRTSYAKQFFTNQVLLFYSSETS